jgi:multidrug efflux pump subunit AcrA (membrane-fusion protein)
MSTRFLRLTRMVVLMGTTAGAACSSASSSSLDTAVTLRVTRGTFSRVLRLTGLVEAAVSTTFTVPRLQGPLQQQGPGAGVLVVTRLAAGGSMVKAGDVIVQFDPQTQERVAFERRSEYEDFAAQLARKQAEHEASRTADESALVQAKNAAAKARLEMLKNEMLAAIQVEKNEQTLAEAEASLEMLTRTFEIKRRAERAERRALEIQRDRAQAAMQHAQRNIQAMTMRAAHDGMIVLKSVWKMGQMGEVQEGEEVRPGLPLVDVIDPARMRVRARVNQADAPLVRDGQSARLELEAYPGRWFNARVESIAPAAVTSSLSPRARWFTATLVIDGADPLLLPDLTAAVDVVLERQDKVLIVPRESLEVSESGAVVQVQSGDDWTATSVKVGSLSDTDAVILAGLQEGAVIRRRPGGGQ